MCTGTPSTRIVPPSAAWTPDSTLIIVDLPAPLSPTSAITSAGRTSRSAPRRASTLPNDLKMSRISNRGVARSEPRSAAERSSEVTCGGGVAGAQVVSRDEPVVDHSLDVVDVDHHRVEEQRRHVVAVVVEGVGEVGRLLAAGQGDGDLGGGSGLLVQVLVHRHRLVAEQDLLKAGDRGVLSGDDDLTVELAGLEGSDHPLGEAVVGGED